ncbi:dephospho-CoA kinase/protein folding accessory domain-containing protein [Streptomyces sp. YIM 130001]|uniref:GrpB family protein n=1 Tax=Streptomyces sp. YIM 130001 TaxID=2259644 RepID=UPI000ED5F038|nr:GrpB family protein [Streptomyces sp. YIM 130001]RII17678.1 dephospho-CoA kinase/protein folding accessory domain-containing protein [Streptomyces sp. YIM 130001]
MPAIDLDEAATEVRRRLPGWAAAGIVAGPVTWRDANAPWPQPLETERSRAADPDSTGIMLHGPSSTELQVVLFRGGWADVLYLASPEDAGALPASGIASVTDFAARLDGWVARAFGVASTPGPRTSPVREGEYRAAATIASITASEIEDAQVGGASRLDDPVALREYDPRWPGVFEREAVSIRAALAGLDHRVEHVGSTSVPGLPAKPIVDILLTLQDPADEPDYVPALEALGYTLVIREPDRCAHRVLRRHDPGPAAERADLHVLPAGCEEAGRMTRFRDRLRAHRGDRVRYADTKHALAGRSREYLQHYADAKSEVVEDILRRAESPSPSPSPVNE